MHGIEIQTAISHNVVIRPVRPNSTNLHVHGLSICLRLNLSTRMRQCFYVKDLLDHAKQVIDLLTTLFGCKARSPEVAEQGRSPKL